jgi:membrane-associated protein
MEIIDFVLHIDKHLEAFISSYGTLVYLLLFLIVFCETGLVVTPFLPGDSLLFAAGALAANPINNLNVGIIIVILIIGEGAKLFGIFTIRKDYLDKTHTFYEKNGPRTIILARFVPIVRTFAPFVAGVGSMTYSKYITYCIAGAILWVTLLTITGYAFGNIPWIKQNFELVVFGIILVSLLPIVFEFIKNKRKQTKS